MAALALLPPDFPDDAPDTVRTPPTSDDTPPPTLPSARFVAGAEAPASEAMPSGEIVERSGLREAVRREEVATVDEPEAWLDVSLLDEDTAPDTEPCAPVTLRSAR